MSEFERWETLIAKMAELALADEHFKLNDLIDMVEDLAPEPANVDAELSQVAEAFKRGLFKGISLGLET